MSRITSSSSTGNVTIQPINPGAEAVFVYNEVTAVAAGVETVIATYTAPTATGVYLLGIQASGSNIGEVRVYVNAAAVDKQYLYYTSFNVTFGYETGVSGAPGLLLNAGDVVYVKGLNSGQGATSCNFNAKIQILEVL